MNKTLYIWHHLGMGDHIIANGIVRYYASIYDKIILFYKNPNKEKVKRLYKDLTNISFLNGGTKEDQLAKGWELLNPSKNLLKMRLESKLPLNMTLDTYFYNQANVPFEYKWSNFFLERDINREKEVFYDILNLKDNEEFIFIHDEKNDKTKSIRNDIKIIRPNQEVSIFDYLFTMEKSKEIHLMNSSFYCLVDCIQLKHNNLNFHEYIRQGNGIISKLNWKVIN
jgi:hypothetical protein